MIEIYLLWLQSKLIRVLNLWQKNNVFTSAIVQPLLDLVADANNPKTIARGKVVCSASVLVRNLLCEDIIGKFIHICTISSLDHRLKYDVVL